MHPDKRQEHEIGGEVDRKADGDVDIGFDHRGAAGLAEAVVGAITGGEREAYHDGDGADAEEWEQWRSPMTYEEAIEKMAETRWNHYAATNNAIPNNSYYIPMWDQADCDGDRMRENERAIARLAAEAIGLKDMMERLDKLRAAVGRLGGSEAFATPRAIDPREKELLKRIEFAREHWNL
jgi:predicted NACHT family NTPase